MACIWVKRVYSLSGIEVIGKQLNQPAFRNLILYQPGWQDRNASPAKAKASKEDALSVMTIAGLLALKSTFSPLGIVTCQLSGVDKRLCAIHFAEESCARFWIDGTPMVFR